ncbi:MAG: hypothetical protein KJO98_14260 [Rhodothermia bacterium]|nr:hypothetical protein [Rhodothermia bacterium]
MQESSSRDDSWESLESFRCGEAGIDFDTLCHFARPIFHLFGFDAAENSTSLDAEQVDDQVAALETARLMWAFFESGGQRDWEQTRRLQSVLFGQDCSIEEMAAMSALLEQLSSNWESLPVVVRRSRNGRASFDDLVAALNGRSTQEGNHNPHHSDPSTNGQAHGDHPVESPEALAAFASPLLDDPSIDENPDLLSEMMARAQDYWHLATLTGDEFVHEIERLSDKYSTTTEEKSAVLAEANLMVARFHKLFPHWT